MTVLASETWHGIPRGGIVWHPRVVAERCVGCGMCVTSCGRGVYAFDYERNKPAGSGDISRLEAVTQPGIDRTALSGGSPAPSATPTCDECSIWATRSAAMATSVSGQHRAARPPVARAVMFWRDGCLHCHKVLDRVLPPIQDKYGEQFELVLIEVLTPEDVELLMAAAAAFGIPDGSVGVPLLLIGDQALMGAWEIPSELPGLIERFLAQGGVDYPEITGLAPRLPDQTRSTQAPASPDVTARAEGFGLAIAVLHGMGIGLACALVRWVRGLGDR
jgi:ferredoxin